MSPPEVRLWAVLRRPPFDAYHFRRQVPLGPFYADFASHGARLVVEVDGAGHFEAAEASYDRARDAFISGQGYLVLRFTTSEVMNNLEGTAVAILARLPPPVAPAGRHPPHKGEGWARAESPGQDDRDAHPSPAKAR